MPIKVQASDVVLCSRSGDKNAPPVAILDDGNIVRLDREEMSLPFFIVTRSTCVVSHEDHALSLEIITNLTMATMFGGNGVAIAPIGAIVGGSACVLSGSSAAVAVLGDVGVVSIDDDSFFKSNGPRGLFVQQHGVSGMRISIPLTLKTMQEQFSVEDDSPVLAAKIRMDEDDFDAAFTALSDYEKRRSFVLSANSAILLGGNGANVNLDMRQREAARMAVESGAVEPNQVIEQPALEKARNAMERNRERLTKLLSTAALFIVPHNVLLDRRRSSARGSTRKYDSFLASLPSSIMKLVELPNSDDKTWALAEDVRSLVMAEAIPAVMSYDDNTNKSVVFVRMAEAKQQATPVKKKAPAVKAAPPAKKNILSAAIALGNLARKK